MELLGWPQSRFRLLTALGVSPQMLDLMYDLNFISAFPSPEFNRESNLKPTIRERVGRVLTSNTRVPRSKHILTKKF